MLLNNYYNFCQCKMKLPVTIKLPNGNTSSTDNYGSDYGTSTIVNSLGAYALSVPSGTQYGSASDHFYGIIFGDGNTAVTTTDYTLSGNIVNSYNANITRETGTDYVAGSIAISATADITIREVGLIVCWRTAGATMREFMVSRIVLETPLVISNGGAATIKLKFTSTNGLEVE